MSSRPWHEGGGLVVVAWFIVVLTAEAQEPRQPPAPLPNNSAPRALPSPGLPSPSVPAPGGPAQRPAVEAPGLPQESAEEESPSLPANPPGILGRLGANL